MTIIYKDNVSTRLDKYLAKQFSKISRSQIQKMIKKRKVLVNDEKSAAHHFLKNGDKIKLKIDFAAAKTRRGAFLRPNKNIKLNIISETGDYIVINKPAGLLVHSTKKDESDTLANGLLFYYPEIKNVGEVNVAEIEDDNGRCRLQRPRPGIVHRLDKNVSGVMVVAKTQKMFKHLKKQFQNRTIKKEYVALVHGKMENLNGVIDFPVGKNKKTGKIVSRPKSTTIKSKNAITKYEVIKQFQNYTLLNVQIKTGRTHQIRVHLNALGHPIVGDQIYKPKNLRARVKLDRLFLHARVLKFNNLNNKRMEVRVNMPERLNNFLINLK